MALLVVGAGFASNANAAGLIVAAGSIDTVGTDMNLNCDDLEVNGTLNITGGAQFTRVRNVVIGPSGSLNILAGATLQVASSWSNAGTFAAGNSSVTLVSDCGTTTTTFSGSTTFNNLTAQTPGHTIQLPAGSEQTVRGLLALSGVTLQGQGGTAYLTLEPGGTQNISSVGVSNVDATRGQRLAPQGSNLLTGAAPNWFSNPASGTPFAPTPVPATGPLALVLMGAMFPLAAAVGATP